MTREYSNDELLDILQNSLCKCGNVGDNLHPCPFSSEIYDDNETLCNCCSACSDECSMDV